MKLFGWRWLYWVYAVVRKNGNTSCYGPFTSRRDATEYAKRHYCDGNWQWEITSVFTNKKPHCVLPNIKKLDKKYGVW